MAGVPRYPSPVPDMTDENTPVVYIGALIMALDDNEGGKDNVIVIHDVIQDSPAAAAGLQKHDRILSINRVPLQSKEQFIQCLHEAEGDTTMELIIIRKKEQLTVTLNPQVRAKSGRNFILRTSNVATDDMLVDRDNSAPPVAQISPCSSVPLSSLPEELQHQTSACSSSGASPEMKLSALAPSTLPLLEQTSAPPAACLSLGGSAGITGMGPAFAIPESKVNPYDV